MAHETTDHTDRSHGGPGSSHENADKPGETGHKRASGGRDNDPPQPGEATNPNRSRSSGGGGERDKHHTHDPKTQELGAEPSAGL